MSTKIGCKRKEAHKPMKKTIKLNPLDILFSKYIRAKAGYTCEYCGKKTQSKRGLHCSHFIGRRYHKTRWLEANCACLCFSCHNYMHDFPATHKDFFIKRLGSPAVETLEIIARSGNKPDLPAIEQDLKNKLKQMEGKEE